MNLTDFANELLGNNVCVVPCKMPGKYPDLKEWSTFQKVRPHPGQHKFNGAAGVITGQISGNMFVLDVDIKYDLNGGLLERLEKAIGTELWEKIFAAAYIQRTVNNGLHIFLRCEQIEGNQKLAQRPTTDEERIKEPLEKTKVLLETRGEGGFIVIAPTEGYTAVSGDLLNVGYVTPDEKEDLFQACRSLNEVFEEVRPPSSKKFIAENGLTPWADYDQRCDAPAYLEVHFGKYFKTVGKNMHFVRAGKNYGTSGTWNAELNLFRCFTSSTLLQADKSYSPSALFAYLECGGDFSEAGRRLRAAGYGERTQQSINRQKKITSKAFKLFRLTQPTSMERPKKLFTVFWAEHENAFLFGEDGTCKSILAVQIGCAIATGQSIPGFPMEVSSQPVALIDAELSDYQFNNRYPDGLPENFKRFTFDEDQQAALIKADIDFVVDQIRQAADSIGARVIVLDNLSALSSMLDLTKTSDSIQLMALLNELKKQGYSVLIIDHTRKPQKENEFKAISKHDLQGSKMKTNLVDSVFSIGKSCQGENIRYLKALKVRSYEMAYTKTGVATMQLRTDPLRLEFLGIDPEWCHLNDRNSKVDKLSGEGKSQADIAREFGISQQAVSKILNGNGW